MNILVFVLTALLVFTAATATACLFALRALNRRFDSAVRESVAVALADDREREMAEARSFWAEQEARMAEDDLGGGPLFDSESVVMLPAPRGYVDEQGEMDPEFADALRSALEEMISETSSGSAGHPVAPAGDRPDRAELPERPLPSDRPAHPSVPGFVPRPTPTPEWTDLRLDELVAVGITLRDVRPGPMGTLDVYIFEDETTLCIAPGDPVAGAKLRAAVDAGAQVRLLGNSRLPGGHALTFALSTDSTGTTDDGEHAAESADETVYILADRVVASL
ncbi:MULTISPECIES: hypothetical protein [Streptacidiphilus]|uniref:Secreted protein n=1 Tax=Streptacidiphilus cavernicola TaxID=3342716 RepID=A0ABV6UM29_9ACTN|nr:hypothetical protein [Streptacidiphilus jeojiense]